MERQALESRPVLLLSESKPSVITASQTITLDLFLYVDLAISEIFEGICP